MQGRWFWWSLKQIVKIVSTNFYKLFQKERKTFLSIKSQTIVTCTIVYLGKIRREKKRFFPSPFFFITPFYPLFPAVLTRIECNGLEFILSGETREKSKGKGRGEGRKNARERETRKRASGKWEKKRNRSHECNVFACSVVDAKQPFDTINTADR